MTLALEAFDAPLPPPEPAGPSPDWREGFAEGLAQGLAEGRAEAEAEGARLSRDLAQAMQDTAFTYAEARAQVLGSLGPLFRLLADRLLPALAGEALGPWIAEVLGAAAASDSDRPLVVEVHPDRLGAVAACLPPGWPGTLAADPSLGPNAARIADGATESDLDLDACLAVLAQALGAFHEPAAEERRLA